MTRWANNRLQFVAAAKSTLAAIGTPTTTLIPLAGRALLQVPWLPPEGILLNGPRKFGSAFWVTTSEYLVYTARVEGLSGGINECGS
jgi:hypothetical protein